MPATHYSAPPAGLFALLPAHGFRAVAPAAALINTLPDAEAAIAAAQAFAATWEDQGDSLVLNILAAHAPADWTGARNAALLWAFTRHAALAWAPRGIRVNALGFGVSPLAPGQVPDESALPAGQAPAGAVTPEDVARLVAGIWRLKAMTGQLIRLPAEGGVA